MIKALTQPARVLGRGAGAAVLLGLGYVAATWYRYGRPKRRALSRSLLERFLPTCEIDERHTIVVDAPAAITYAVAKELDLQQSWLIRAIFAGRELIMRSRADRPVICGSFLQQVLALGWGILAEEPGREIVLGAVTQPWKANVKFRSLPPEEFAAYREPGFAKIAWTLAAEPLDRERSVFRTETRVGTTDLRSRKLFRRYWSVFSPGILLIRRETLRLVKREAERRAAQETLQVADEAVERDLHIGAAADPA